MKVSIGPYSSDLIPIRRLEHAYIYDKYYQKDKDYDWLDKIVLGFLDKLEDFVGPINRWWNNRKRKVKVHIDYYDVWSADHTLAIIIAPTLKKLKGVQQGYPHVDNEDVPEELRFTLTDKEKLEWDGTVDSKHEARWNYVLDEMIWAFEQYAADDDEKQFYHNSEQLEMLFVPSSNEKLDNKGMKSLEFNYQKDPMKPKYWVDEEGRKNHHERKKNGLRLFAKYYESLWD